MLVPCLAYSSTLKMKATCSSKTSVDFQQTWQYIREDRTLRNHSWENLKSDVHWDCHSCGSKMTQMLARYLARNSIFYTHTHTHRHTHTRAHAHSLSTFSCFWCLWLVEIVYALDYLGTKWNLPACATFFRHGRAKYTLRSYTWH
jgi:hypothetical protein